MSTRHSAALAAVFSVALVFVVPSARGAAMAFDNASDPVYLAVLPNPDLLDGLNGGSGFAPWILTPTVETLTLGAFIASSQPNGTSTDPKGNIDSVGGRAWGLFANAAGSTSAAVRLFTPGGSTGNSNLGIGEQFIIKFDNGQVAAGGAVGFGLQNSAGKNRFEFYYGAGNSGYTLNIANDVITPHGVTYAGMTIKFTLTSPDTFNLDINYAVGTPSSESFSGVLQEAPGSGIDRFRLFNFGASAGGLGGSNVYFNDVQVIPEPSSLVLLAAGALAATRRRVRR